MRNIYAIFGAFLLGIAAYLFLFTAAVYKPLTIDSIASYVARKRTVLATVSGPRIIIMAGSNGRFSHSCVEITARTGIRCVNLSNAAGIGYKYQFGEYLDLIHPGDLIYLPLEYRRADFYDPDFVGDESKVLMYRAPARLFQLYSWRGVLEAAFAYDPRYLISGIGEMLLHHAGIGRRFSLGTMNAVGDETGHNAVAAAPYRTYVSTMSRIVVDKRAYTDLRYWTDMTEAISALRQRGAIVVGGLPTTFDDTLIGPATIPFLQRFYASQGACFVILPNRSLYPRASFFDTEYHLQERWQHYHSELLAPELARIFRTGRCP
jgi:hypothetical protein